MIITIFFINDNKYAYYFHFFNIPLLDYFFYYYLTLQGYKITPSIFVNKMTFTSFLLRNISQLSVCE